MHIQNPSVQALAHGLAGGLAGIGSLSMLYPMDFYQIVRRVSSRKISTRIKEDGILSFYEGLGMSLVQNGVSYSAYTAIYAYIKTAFETATHAHITESPFYSLMTGVIAAMCNTLMTAPIRVMQVRAMTATERGVPNETPFEGLKTVVKAEGVQGLWKGLPIGLALSFNPALTSMVFEKLKHMIKLSKLARGGPAELTAAEAFLCGAAAKFVATVPTYPFILVRTKMQVKGQKATFSQVIKNMWREKGIFAFYQGVKPKLIFQTLHSATMFAIKERVTVYTFLGVGLFLRYLAKLRNSPKAMVAIKAVTVAV